MAVYQNKQLIKKLIERNNACIAKVEQDFKALTEEQLNFKVSKDKWSIVECLIHIIKADDIYLDQLKKMIQQKPDAELSYKAGWLGNYFAEGIIPKNGKLDNTMKTFKVMDPNHNMDLLSKEFLNTNETLDAFITQQKTINDYMALAINHDLGKLKIQTAIPLVKIKLGDAFRFLVGHNERHIFQASKIVSVVL